MHTDNNRVAKILRKIPCLDGLVMRERERERERERANENQETK